MFELSGWTTLFAFSIKDIQKPAGGLQSTHELGGLHFLSLTMAKDLPYFKFNVSEWNDGDVTLCSMEAQGLFINLCSIYWSKEGELSLAKARLRFQNCESAWDELTNQGIIKVLDDAIMISFLDEQLEERGRQSVTNSKNASIRWEKERIDAVAMRSQCGRIDPACNIEKKREEERREEKKREEPVMLIPFDGQCLISWNYWVEYRKDLRKKMSKKTIEKQIQFLGGRPPNEIIAIIDQSIQNGWAGLFELKKQTNGAYKRNTNPTTAIIEPGQGFGGEF